MDSGGFQFVTTNTSQVFDEKIWNREFLRSNYDPSVKVNGGLLCERQQLTHKPHILLCNLHFSHRKSFRMWCWRDNMDTYHRIYPYNGACCQCISWLRPFLITAEKNKKERNQIISFQSWVQHFCSRTAKAISDENQNVFFFPQRIPFPTANEEMLQGNLELKRLSFSTLAGFDEAFPN